MQCLLVLNTSPELEEDLVDFFLERQEIMGFTSYPVQGHGEHDGMTVPEQVSGRRRRLQFEILLEQTAVDALLEALGRDVGRDIYFREQEIGRAGRL